MVVVDFITLKPLLLDLVDLVVVVMVDMIQSRQLVVHQEQPTLEVVEAVPLMQIMVVMVDPVLLLLDLQCDKYPTGCYNPKYLKQPVKYKRWLILHN